MTDNKKLQQFIEGMIKSIGFDYPEELVVEYRKKGIVIVDDKDNVVEVLRETQEDISIEKKE